MPANIVKDLRERLGLSQSELALVLRVSKRTIARWEADPDHGGTQVHPVYLDKLRSMLHAQVVEDVVNEEAQANTSERKPALP